MIRRPGLIAVLGVLTVLVMFMGAVVLYGHFGVSLEANPALEVEIRSGETLGQVARRMSREGILRHPRLLTLLAVLRGESAQIKAGEYVFQGRISPSALLDDWVSGNARFISLTIPEGFSLAEIAARLEAKELGDGKTFLDLAQDPEFIAGLGLSFKPVPRTLEGLIYPETYYFHRGLKERDLIQTMVKEFREKAEGELVAGAGKVGLTPYETLVMASIIEKETGAGSERELISAVFHNRLAARMRLASDPTVIYGLPDFDGNLTRVHLRTKTPYNTYKITGLTPTPIASPGLASIRAALAPAAVDYLFFVSKGDGTHYFSRDYNSHRRAVWKYQIRPHRKRNS